jgi:hypothetical protein
VLPLSVLPSTIQDALATNINGSVEVHQVPVMLLMRRRERS